MNIDQNLFFRFFSREATPQETDALTYFRYLSYSPLSTHHVQNP